MWGSNEFGQLGQGNSVGSFKPVLVNELSTLGIHISQIAMGAFHVLALSSKGNVYAWGYNSNGQLGTSDTFNRALPVRVRKKEPGFLFVSSIAAGYYNSIMVSDRGDIYTFGSNRDGQQGNGQQDMLPHPTPTIMSTLPQLRGLRANCGAYHCLAVTLSLTIYAWGWNSHGQLGTGNLQTVSIPSELSLPSDVPGFAVAVGTGFAHNMIVLQTGDLNFCGVNRWGKNVCLKNAILSPPITNDEGGVWWIKSATAGRIVVEGNEAQEFEASGNIQLYRNETNLGVVRYDNVKNLDGYEFTFESNSLGFSTGDFVPDAVWSTSLLA